MEACKCAPSVADAADEKWQTLTVTVTVRDELGRREGQGAQRDTRPESADSAAWDALPENNVVMMFALSCNMLMIDNKA